ncbi:MAG: hypothetical protein Ct9H300mP13_3250 [Gammaproteobacteria bacterium]|nr:MAG: hypothetical protein Ct9H300mP13_3250 [Gammaproteobacteria bacterium]
MDAMSKISKTYKEKGYVICDNLLPMSVVEELQNITDKIVNAGAALTASDEVYEILDDLETKQSRIERIKSPHTFEPCFDALIRRKEITDVLHALLGRILDYRTVS